MAESESSSLSKDDDPQRLKTTGNSLLAKKDYKGAISAYTKALKALDVNDDSQPSNTRSILYSNRSRAFLSAGFVDASLNDAEQCIESQPTWYKGYIRRAKAYQTKGVLYKHNAIDSYDDAILVVQRELENNEEDGEEDTSNNNSNNKNNNTIDYAAVRKELKYARKLCLEELIPKGPCTLHPDVASMGCLLTVPTDAAKITHRLVLGAQLEPATYDGVDERNNMPIRGFCPGDLLGWPMFCPRIVYNETGTTHPFPLCYYILGPCVLTNVCVNEIDDLMRYQHGFSCRWPEGPETRTCPFCGSAATTRKSGSNGEVFTLVAHCMIGKAKAAGGIGSKVMVQLVCEKCTQKQLLKSKTNELLSENEKGGVEFVYNGITQKSSSSNNDDNNDDDDASDGLPLQRLRLLTNKAHAIKMSVLYNRASTTGLISSFILHASARLQRMMGTMEKRRGGGNSTSAPAAATTINGAKREFFDTWVSMIDERAIYNSKKAQKYAHNHTILDTTIMTSPVSSSFCGGSSGNGHRSSFSDTERYLGSQEFGIKQVAAIADVKSALRDKFWKKHGAGIRSYWLTSLDETSRKDFINDVVFSFVETNMDNWKRRHTSYHHVLDPLVLINKPMGKVPKHKLCILPECNTNYNNNSNSVDLLQLFRDRVAGDTSNNTIEDVALISKIRRENGLPKLQLTESDGSYLCDYMGLEDPKIGPFVVFVGEREPEYDSTGMLGQSSSSSLQGVHVFDPNKIVKLPEYHSLREPIQESITIMSARADGEVRESLNHLLANGVATDAVCLIYAAQRQHYLLEFLQHAAHTYCIRTGNDDPKEMKGWSYHDTTGCYVCNARTQPDGSALLHCSKCECINYCSPDCQKRDWKRHKAESCVNAYKYTNNKTKNKKKKKGKKGKNK